jgi:hypothetical protein
MINSVEKIYSLLDNTFYKISKLLNKMELLCLYQIDEANTDYQAIQEWIAEGNEVIDNGA